MTELGPWEGRDDVVVIDGKAYIVGGLTEVERLRLENRILRDTVKRLEAQKAAVWTVLREAQRVSLTEVSISDILDALGAP